VDGVGLVGIIEIFVEVVFVLVLILIAESHIAFEPFVLIGHWPEEDLAVTALIVDPVTFGQIGCEAFEVTFQRVSLTMGVKADGDVRKTILVAAIGIADMFERGVAESPPPLSENSISSMPRAPRSAMI
jgi:hypothetical protein